MTLLGNLENADTKTAMNIFMIKIAPIMAYGMTAIAPFLTFENLKEIDKVKSTFLKRVLGLPRNAPSTLAHELLGEKTLVQQLKLNGCSFDCSALNRYTEF